MPPLRLSDPAWLVLTALNVSLDARSTSSPSSWPPVVDAGGGDRSNASPARFLPASSLPCATSESPSVSSGSSVAGDSGMLSPSANSGNRRNAGPVLDWLSLCCWLGASDPSSIPAASAAA